MKGVGVRKLAHHLKMERIRVMYVQRAIGLACAALHHALVRNVAVDYVQIDELWSFVGAKQKTVKRQMEAGRQAGPHHRGDLWTFLALHPESIMILSYLNGPRKAPFAECFVADLHSRLANRIMLVSDGFIPYVKAVKQSFGPEGVDYGVVVKIEDEKGRHLRSDKYRVFGNPDMERISTNAIETQNLHHRQELRRLARKTTGHSKIVMAHFTNLALWVAYHNLCYQPARLRGATPAMVVGLTQQSWSIHKLVVEAISTLMTSPYQTGAKPPGNRSGFALE